MLHRVLIVEKNSEMGGGGDRGCEGGNFWLIFGYILLNNAIAALLGIHIGLILCETVVERTVSVLKRTRWTRLFPEINRANQAFFSATIGFCGRGSWLFIGKRAQLTYSEHALN